MSLETAEQAEARSFGETEAEYQAVRGGGAGLIDLSSRGRVEVSGSEAVQFLNGLITNDVKALEEGAWMRAAFPNVQGRLVASVRVLKPGADRFLFDTEAATHERVLKTLERFTLAGDFRVKDLTQEIVLLSVQGAGAAALIGEHFGRDAGAVERGRIFHKRGGGDETLIIRATHTAEDGFDIFIKAGEAEALRDALMRAGARPVSADAFELLRVEAGIPRYGVDVDETNVVLEALEEDAVSYTKGCYLGQEIIARIHWRGHVAKRLSGLSFDAHGAATPGDKVRTADGKDIGRLTSVIQSPALGRIVALGYVKYDYLAPGTEVRVATGDGELTARVSPLPLVRGSWYAAEGEALEGGA